MKKVAKNITNGSYEVFDDDDDLNNAGDVEWGIFVCMNIIGLILSILFIIGIFLIGLYVIFYWQFLIMLIIIAILNILLLPGFRERSTSGYKSSMYSTVHTLSFVMLLLIAGSAYMVFNS